MDDRLTAIVSDASKGLVEDVEAEFVRKKDFYYAWNIRNGLARIQISDYMQDAPDGVLGDMGRAIVLRGLSRPWEIPPSFISYVDSDGFISANRPTFIKRSKNLSRSDRGEFAFLPDSIDRLMDMGLVQPEDIENSYISWTCRDSFRRVGFCSTMFRTVGISSALDNGSISDDARDYVVYHECLHLRQRYRPDKRVHDTEFREWEHMFPGWKACEKELRGLSVH